MRASARWAVALSGRRASSRSTLPGRRRVARPVQGAGQPVLPIRAKRLEIGGDAVSPRSLRPPLQFGEQIGKGSPCFPVAGAPIWRPGSCFRSVAGTGIPESITPDQGRFGEIGRVSRLELEPISFKIGVSGNVGQRPRMDMLQPTHSVNWVILPPLFSCTFEVFKSCKNYPPNGSRLHTG